MNWGENALEELKKECKVFKSKQLEEENERLIKEFSKNMPKCMSCHNPALVSNVNK